MNTLVNFALFVFHLIKTPLTWFLSLFKSTKAKKISRDIVLITAGASDLGQCLAIKFGQQGCPLVVIWDTDEIGLEKTFHLVQKTGAQCWPYVVDITDHEAVHRTAELVKQQVGMVTILVNNASFDSRAAILDLREEAVRKTFDYNVLSHFWTIKAFVGDMIQLKRGHVVTVASACGLVGLPKMAPYCASTGAAMLVGQSLRLELAASGHGKYVHCTLVNASPHVTAGTLSCKIMAAVLSNEQALTIPLSSWVLAALPLECAHYAANFMGLDKLKRASVRARKGDKGLFKLVKFFFPSLGRGINV
ncbi:Estradiol 17-beta-dehydrogenase 11 [Halotydeus destructor]|nr:Estradiol 17-beta-dehydrogenase 11 [Halotydeus destructor]